MNSVFLLEAEHPTKW